MPYGNISRTRANLSRRRCGAWFERRSGEPVRARCRITMVQFHKDILRTRRRLLQAATIWPAFRALQAARKEFWESKDPADWSNEEKLGLLGQSPWAREGMVRFEVERNRTPADRTRRERNAGRAKTPPTGATRRNWACLGSPHGRGKEWCGSKSNGIARLQADPTRAWRDREEVFPAPIQAPHPGPSRVCPSVSVRRRFPAPTQASRCSSGCSRAGKAQSPSVLPAGLNCPREPRGSM